VQAEQILAFRLARSGLAGRDAGDLAEAAACPASELRKRLFRPVASPGAVLRDGRLAGLWQVKARGRKAEITFQRLCRVVRSELEEEAQRICDLRGASEAILVLD